MRDLDYAKYNPEKQVEIEYTTRYDALGIPEPKVETVCLGQCEGTGWVPIHKDDPELEWQMRWRQAHNKSHTFKQRCKTAWLFIKQGKMLVALDCMMDTKKRCDGWHFVDCPDCGGTGKRDDTV